MPLISLVSQIAILKAGRKQCRWIIHIQARNLILADLVAKVNLHMLHELLERLSMKLLDDGQRQTPRTILSASVGLEDVCL
mmetsp:Transcript_15296/g.44773  ORF Transcript_15296/g.44773 Transcript_15296/m.44773 type:complete len:81 (-) Transcript_15296:1081-1323(-)